MNGEESFLKGGRDTRKTTLKPDSINDPQILTNGNRRRFIDFARGVIMILMAWDHAAFFWWPQHLGSEGLGGVFPYLNASLVPFFSRFVTHICAPGFFFLSGASIAISTTRRLQEGASQFEVSLHLVKRAGVLVLLMIFVEGNAFGLGPVYFGVLGCFAASFAIFSVFRRAPWQAILIVSMATVILHPLLNLSFIPNQGAGLLFRMYIHEPSLSHYPFLVLYPIVPWVGVMGLGWGFGTRLNRLSHLGIWRIRLPLAVLGISLFLAFVAIRLTNGFGNLILRKGNTIQAWLAISKYPPDLAFLTITLGGLFLTMTLGLSMENKKWFEKGVTGALQVFGRSPLFFYVVHLIIYRVRPFYMTSPLFQLDLPSTIALWFLGLIVLWRFCLRYERLKRTHPNSLLQYI